MTCPTSVELAGPEGRRLLVEAIFERVDVLGLAIVEITPTPEAESRGWAAAFGEPAVMSVKVKSGRGERSRTSTIHPGHPTLGTEPPICVTVTVIGRARPTIDHKSQ